MNKASQKVKGPVVREMEYEKGRF